MAIKKIEMRPVGSGNYEDILFPKTSADMVVTNDGGNTEQHIGLLHTRIDGIVDRFGQHCQVITDWNNARQNGFYMGNGATNGPESGWYMGTVISHDLLYCHQEVIGVVTGRKFQRRRSAGVWEEWMLVNIGNLANLQTTNKTNLVGAINELFTSANNGKTAIANAVNAKGVSASPSDTFPVLASKIGQINTGKKWTSGEFPTVTLPPGGSTYARTVNHGLTVKPSVIIVRFTFSGACYNSMYFNKDGLEHTVLDGSMFYDTFTHLSGITADSFYFAFRNSQPEAPRTGVFSWVAIE